MMFCFGGRPQRQAALSHIPQGSEERQTLDSVFTKCSAETLAFNETDWTNWRVLSSATRPRFLLFIWWLNVLEAPKLLLPQHVFLLASLDLSTVSAEPDVMSNVKKDGIIMVESTTKYSLCQSDSNARSWKEVKNTEQDEEGESKSVKLSCCYCSVLQVSVLFCY